MRHHKLRLASLVATLLLVSASSFADIKRTTYPQVKVALAPVYTPDAAFNNFRKQLIEAVNKKDSATLFSLVAPGFVPTMNNMLTSDFDAGRDAQHNFRVVFGFRPAGKDADDSVEGGPFWEALAVFVNENTYYQLKPNLICSPMAASIVEPEAFEKARAAIDTPEEIATWYFTLRPTPVQKSPQDNGPAVAQLSLEAVAILKAEPAAETGQTPTHFEILLPSGRTGWIAADAVRPLQADQLCYAQTAKGEWKIAIFDGTH